MKKTLHEQVSEFHRAAEIPILDKPQVPPDERVRLRAALIAEEAFETLEAMFHCAPTDSSLAHLKTLVQQTIQTAPVKVNLEAVVDGFADLDYVVEGSRLEFGIDGAPIAALVHEANMKKVGPGSWHREDGKIMKPEDWTPPDIHGALLEQAEPLIPLIKRARDKWIASCADGDLTKSSCSFHESFTHHEPQPDRAIATAAYELTSKYCDVPHAESYDLAIAELKNPTPDIWNLPRLIRATQIKYGKHLLRERTAQALDLSWFLKHDPTPDETLANNALAVVSNYIKAGNHPLDDLVGYRTTEYKAFDAALCALRIK